MMRIADTVHKTQTAEEIHFLLTSYLESLEYAGLPDRTLLAYAIALPLGDKDDVKARLHALIRELDAASRQLDDHACTIIKEAVYIFGAALHRLHALEQEAAQIDHANGIAPLTALAAAAGNSKTLAANHRHRPADYPC